VLSNVSAKVALTPYALRDLFTSPIGHRVVSVPSAAVAAGYEVALYSGQAKTGMYDGSDELLFAACRTRQYLCDILPNESYHDGALIPLVRQAVTSAVPKQLVFVHTYGSHCNWSARFPPSFARFTEDLVDKEVEGLSRNAAMSVNDYDNSILYTDYVVSELLRTAQSQERPTVFVYVADHGESPRSVGRNHDHPDTHAIPCFLWFSEGYRRLHPNLVQRVQALCKANLVSTELFSLWLDLLGIVH